MGKDDGVSPVVGVMLMLVVTIIIAALVSSFASGLGTADEAPPSVSLKVSLYGGDLEKTAVVENLAGESLRTADLQIITSYTVPEKRLGTTLADAGKVIMHTIDGQLEPIDANDINVDADGYPFLHQVTNNADNLTTRTANNKFGEMILSPGSSMYFDLDYFVGFNTTTGRTRYAFETEKSELHVSIVHIPSGKLLYDKDVRLS